MAQLSSPQPIFSPQPNAELSLTPTVIDTLPGPTALPVPAPKHVADFQALYHRRWGVSLPSEEAHITLTALMQFVYLREQYLRKTRRDQTHSINEDQ